MNKKELELAEIEEEKKKKRRTKKALIYSLLTIILILALALLATNISTLVNWYMPESTPSISLISPINNQILNIREPLFNWSSSGAGPLTHVWYSDALNTFSTPLYTFNNTGLGKSCHGGPYKDGTWYWRAEVSNGAEINVSETRRFFIKTNITNNFPNLTNPIVAPMTGSPTTIFTYQVTFTDADNDTAQNVTAYIDAAPFPMIELVPLDTNTTDGKVFTFSTTLALGTHTYQFYAEDGHSFNITALFTGPTVTIEEENPIILTKMNSVEIRPHNILSYPGETFTGTIRIVQEGGHIIYEVYWYIYLLDLNDVVVSSDFGSQGLDGEVIVDYDIFIPNATQEGDYRLFARTFDAPRELPLSNPLGQDSENVKVVKKIPAILPSFDEIAEKVIENWMILLVFSALMILFLFLAYKKKKGYLLVMSLAISMLILMFYKILEFSAVSYFGILLIFIGSLFFTKHHTSFRIKTPERAKIVGSALVVLGAIIFIYQYL